MSEISIIDINYSPPSEINWDLCFLCQKGSTKDNMRCPSIQSKRSNIMAGYETLEKNIKEFKALNKLPFVLNNKLFESENMSETLNKNNAKWHVSCGNKINSKEIVRAKKRTAKEMEANILINEEVGRFFLYFHQIYKLFKLF